MTQTVRRAPRGTGVLRTAADGDWNSRMIGRAGSSVLDQVSPLGRGWERELHGR